MVRKPLLIPKQLFLRKLYINISSFNEVSLWHDGLSAGRVDRYYLIKEVDFKIGVYDGNISS